MKNLFLFCISFLFLSFSSFSQNKEIKGKEINLFDLEGADYIFQSIPLENKSLVDVEIINIQTKEISQIPEGASMNNHFEPDVYLGTARKKNFANINIPIYRTSNGKIEQLISYDLLLKTNKTVSKPKTDLLKSASASILATGSWHKISIPKRGIYKIDYTFLQSIGVNPSQINPANIRLYGNGGTVIPEIVDSTQADDLIENAIFVSSSGSTFGQSDYILFYANGPTAWEPNPQKDAFVHTPNYYEDKSYYFLNFDIGSGKRIEQESLNGTAVTNFSNFDDYAVIDKDSFNIAGMGKVWWSNKMSSGNTASLTQNLSINLGGVSGPIKIRTKVGSVSDGNGNIFKLSINNQLAESLTTTAHGGNFLSQKEAAFEFNSNNNSNLNIKLQYIPAGTGAGYLDYLSFNYKRPIKFSGNSLIFRNLESLTFSDNEFINYTIQDATTSMKVWNITNPLVPISVTGQLQNGSFNFLSKGGKLNEFVAFSGNQFPLPKSEGNVSNQNLHGLPQTDYLIITNNNLLPAAEELADFHRQHYGTKVTVVTKDKIYNEFSSGGQDIGGIRNFIKMFYDRANDDENMLKNVLFLGAASYDYKDRIEANTNIVPTYQTYESANGTSSFSSDDYFGLLDHGENISSINGMLDLGLGRIPAYSLEEARAVVKKIKHYVSAASFGPWKNVVSFVADDKDTDNSMNHLNDCETGSTYFRTDNNDYNLYKIYADAYPVVSGSGGNRYPSVNKAINDQIYNGAFLMSYSGHGNPRRWAHEGILVEDDYKNWKNLDKLPVMITATCDFGRFDDPEVRSAGAYLMLKPEGGSIAMVTTTQAVYATSNTSLTKKYVQLQFEKTSTGAYRTLGQALTEAKNATSNGENSYKFVILGDPALHLAFPEYKIKTDSLILMEGEGLSATDTIKALGKYTLKGSVTTENDQIVSSFNGTVFITVFDKEITVQTVNPFPTATPTFELQNNIVARIKSKVENGQFSAQFLAPKDINYDYGSGKISYYAHSDSHDASGVDAEFTVGGYNEHADDDNEPPIVKAYIDDEKFRDGGVTGPNPLLYVKLYDDNGINVSGTSLGHDLVAILDGDTKNPMNMNDFYQTEENDYKNGYVHFPLYNLPDGKHTIKVKAWDTHNNSGEGSVTFVVNNPEKGFISDLYNYPNPVTDQTHFVFQHNQKGVKMNFSLQIYNTSGALVKEFNQALETNENRTELIWNGKGEGDVPLAKGVYFYKLNIITEEGITATAYQKLVLLR